MYSLDINTQQYNNYTMSKPIKATEVNKDKEIKEQKVAFTSKPLMTNVPFNSALSASRFRTELSSKDEKNKYNELKNV